MEGFVGACVGVCARVCVWGVCVGEGGWVVVGGWVGGGGQGGKRRQMFGTLQIKSGKRPQRLVGWVEE